MMWSLYFATWQWQILLFICASSSSNIEVHATWFCILFWNLLNKSFFGQNKVVRLKAAGSYQQGSPSIHFVFTCYCLIFRENFSIFYRTFRHVKKKRGPPSVYLVYSIHSTSQEINKNWWYSKAHIWYHSKSAPRFAANHVYESVKHGRTGNVETDIIFSLFRVLKLSLFVFSGTDMRLFRTARHGWAWSMCTQLINS